MPLVNKSALPWISFGSMHWNHFDKFCLHLFRPRVSDLKEKVLVLLYFRAAETCLEKGPLHILTGEYLLSVTIEQDVSHM